MTTESQAPDNLESVLRRVQKLLAIAADERANPAEAAAAASQAEKIMRKYQIEHSDLVAASMKRDDSFGAEFAGTTMNPMARASSTTTWSGMLGLAIGKLNDCITTYERSYEKGVQIRFAGYKADAQVALWTYLYVVSQMSSTLRRHQAMYDLGRRDSEDFRVGFVKAVVHNIERAIAEKKREMSGAESSRALVVVKHDEVARRFGEQRVKQNKGRRASEAGDAGYAEGQKVDITRRGVAQSANQAQRLGS